MINLSTVPRYKHINVRIGHHISAMAGAGTNFLGSILSPQVDKKVSNNINEYYCNLPFNRIDNFMYDWFNGESTNPIPENELYRAAKSIDSMECDIMLSHMPPLFISKLFNTVIGEISIIDDSSTRWFSHLLRFIKQETSNDFSEQSSYKVNVILEKYFVALQRSQDKDQLIINPQDINNFMNVLWSKLESSDIIQPRSVLAYDVYFDMLLNADTDAEKYLNRILNQKTSNWIDQRRPSRVLAETYSYLSDRENANIINYESLFFQLEVPNTPNWVSVDKSKIREYSIKNIALVKRLASLLNDPLRDRVMADIGKFNQDLLNA